MTQEEISQYLPLISSDPKGFINAFMQVNTNVPKWSHLRVQYDPNEHAILKNMAVYPPIPDKNGRDEMKRITRDYQKLACDRLGQSMFSTPVERIYDYNSDDTKQAEAVDILEDVYRVKNRIDSKNIERSKKLNASCQVATIWRGTDKPMRTNGKQSTIGIAHTTYSEMDGYKIYPIFDEYGSLIALSICYTRTSDSKEIFITYIGGTDPLMVSFVNEKEWKVDTSKPDNPKKLSVFPCVYASSKTPAWGGDSGTRKVESIEEAISFRSYYIKKNSAPMAYVDMGDTSKMKKSDDSKKPDETNEDKKRVNKLGIGGKIVFPTWDMSAEAFKDHIDSMRDAFFEDNQIPDNSFANLLSSNTSADNKEIVLVDSKAKAVDIGGEWIDLFQDEFEILVQLAGVAFPEYKETFLDISMRSVITPYNVKTDKDNAEIVSTAGDSMSLETKIRTIGKVTNVQDEKDRIIEDNRTNSTI